MRIRRISLLLVAMLASAGAAPPADGPRDAPRLFAAPWIDGTDPAEPTIQVQALDADTFVLRQSLRTHSEAPFLYLIFGRDRVLLVDTGAGGVAVRPTVDRLIGEWLAANRRRSIPLVVAHSHAHRDHIAGDAEFHARPDTTVVGLTLPEVARFFDVQKWPNRRGRIELGGRRLTVLPTPGHQIAHVMFYDPRLRIIVSGDALYPGRIYVPANRFAEMRESVDRMVAFVRQHRVRAVLGAHIELDRDGRDYASSVTVHPNEHRLELPPRTFEDMRRGLNAERGTPMEAVRHRQALRDRSGACPRRLNAVRGTRHPPAGGRCCGPLSD